MTAWLQSPCFSTLPQELLKSIGFGSSGEIYGEVLRQKRPSPPKKRKMTAQCLKVNVSYKFWKETPVESQRNFCPSRRALL
jgi:hypothetical protein